MSDLVKRLRIKAGMIEMGERIAWGSDSALMYEAADMIDRLLASEEQYTPADMADQGAKQFRAGQACMYTAEDMCSQAAQGYRDGYAAAKGEACPEGYVMVPMKPTPEWVANLRNIRIGSMESVIEDVLAAAPAVQGEQEAVSYYERAHGKKSPTHGMSLYERIEHVGGRTNAAGYIEFDSVMAVSALIDHVLRDSPAPRPALTTTQGHLVGEMISNDGDIYWTDQHPPMGTKLYATPQPAEQQPEYGDAYQGARTDVAIWKRRALEAEQRVREQDQIIDRMGEDLNAINGPTFMGEPVLPKKQPEPDVAQLVEALEEGLRAIGDHHAPGDCYATGPMTGDPFRDLVQCPACSFIAMCDDLLAAHRRVTKT